jgi:hypothetical protein
LESHRYRKVVGGKGSVMVDEAEIARALLSELTGAPYVVTLPRKADKLKRPKWYVTCLDGAYYDQTAHAETIWSDNEGKVWIESSHIGSTTSWAEEAYGEQGARQAMDGDYRNLTLMQVRNQMKGLPKVYDRIENYKRTVEDISRKSGVRMEMLCDGRADVGWFLFRAQISPKEPDKLEDMLSKAAIAMREVYDLTETAHMRNLLRG